MSLGGAFSDRPYQTLSNISFSAAMMSVIDRMPSAKIACRVMRLGCWVSRREI